MMTGSFVALLALLLAAAFAAIVFDRARTEAAGLRLLVEMSGLLQVSTTFRDAVEIVPVFGRHLFPAVDGALYIGSGSRFEVASSWGDATGNANTHDPRCAAGEPCGDDATLCLPLLSAGTTMGMLTLRSRDGQALESRVGLFAHAFADHIALALANLRLQETLRTHAVRDGLTGVFNRRHMEETLASELRRKSRTGVIVVDVDHFKAFNDTYGHCGGDALLQQLAGVMRSSFSDDAVVCRYGGDEFVIVLPDTRPELVRERAERFREAVRAQRLHADGATLGGVTVSVGFAYAPDHANTIDGLIAAADRALYTAKTAGRDRVASPPPQALGRDAA
ncbi:MAG TPA: sensor domain-containing diguanylate cyclase [Thermoanaerobaculia bacterium]|jgi:diguanylate cyclase (GGDEF)-like protein